MADINVKVTFDKINVKEKIQEHKVKILMLKGEKSDKGNAVWGSITGDISTQTDLQNVLNGKASAESVATNTSDISDLQTIVATNTSDISSLSNEIENKQDNLTAGTGIEINNNTVSAKYGTVEGTACQGNDSRLSNSRMPTAHASSETTYGIGTTTNYGHCKTINNLTSSKYANGEALSAYQGKVLDNKISSISGRFITKNGSSNTTISHTFTSGQYALIILCRTNGESNAGLYLANFGSTGKYLTTIATYSQGDLTLSNYTISVTVSAATEMKIILL